MQAQINEYLKEGVCDLLAVIKSKFILSLLLKLFIVKL